MPRAEAMPIKDEHEGPVDNHPAVVEAGRRRDEVKAALTAVKLEERTLHEAIAPPKRRIETATPMTVMAFTPGTGFGRREHIEVTERWEQPDPDPVAARRARLELPAVELRVLDLTAEADESEAAFRSVRQGVYQARSRGSDARVKSAVVDFARDLALLVEKAQYLLRVVDQENVHLGRDERGRLRYHASEVGFPPLLTSDPRTPCLAEFWRERVRAAGWLP
jgi:hypothetical protein